MPLEKRCDCSRGKRDDERDRIWAKCGHTWQIHIEIRGQRKRESARTASRRDAERFERDRWAYYDRTIPAQPAGRADIATLAELDIQRAETAGVTEAELDWLEYAWGNIGRHLGGASPVTVITYDRVEQYIRDRMAEGVGGNTVRRERQRIAWAAGVAHRKGWLPLLPSAWPVVKNSTPDPKRRGKLHPAPILRRWFRELRRRHRQAYLEARLIVLTGLRDAEAARCAPSWAQVIAGRPMLEVPSWAAKKRKARLVGLTREALAIIQNLGRGKKPDDPLVGKRWLKKQRIEAARAFGYSGTITKRDLRHTYSTLGLEAAGDATAVQHAMGHADLATTQLYQHSTVERAVAVSLGVEKKLARQPHQNSHSVLNGRGDWIRTSDPLTPSQLSQLLAHVKSCSSCLEHIAQCADIALLHPATATGDSHARRRA